MSELMQMHPVRLQVQLDNQSTIRVEHIDEDSTLPKNYSKFASSSNRDQQESYYALTFWILEVHNIFQSG